MAMVVIVAAVGEILDAIDQRTRAAAETVLAALADRRVAKGCAVKRGLDLAGEIVTGTLRARSAARGPP